MPINQTGAHIDTAAHEYSDEWRVVPLASVADIRFSSVNKVSQPGEQPVRLCNYTDVYNNDYITADMDFMRATATRSEIERFVLQVGDVIITKDSETPDDIGISAVVDTTAPDVVCGYHLALLRPNREEVDPTFLAKQLAHHRIARYFGQQANGSTRYSLSTAAIANALLHLPRRENQRSASVLMRLVDTHITQTEAVIAKLKQVRAGMLHDLLSYGLDENGQLRDPIAHPEQFKDSPLGRLPRTWEHGAVGDLADLSVGPAFQSHFFATGEGVRLLRGINVTQGRLRWDKEITQCWTKITPALHCYKMEVGDVVIGMDGALVGRNVALLSNDDVPSYLVQRVARLRVREDLESNYLFLYLSSHRFLKHVDIRKTHTAIPHICGGDIREFKIVVPPISEQRAILHKVDSIDSQIDTESSELEKLQSLKSGLQDDLLTGRVRVPETIMEGAAVA